MTVHPGELDHPSMRLQSDEHRSEITGGAHVALGVAHTPVTAAPNLARRRTFRGTSRRQRNLAQTACHVGGVGVEEGTVLSLHGKLSRDSVPQLEAVLDGLVLLNPLRLVIDLSEVDQVSSDALNTLLWCAINNGGVVLRAPDPLTRAEVTRRGHARWIETERIAF